MDTLQTDLERRWENWGRNGAMAKRIDEERKEGRARKGRREGEDQKVHVGKDMRSTLTTSFP